MIKTAKEIRPDDKKRVKTGVKTPTNLRSGWGAGRLCGLLAAAGLLADGLGGGWRMLAFLGAGEARREGPPPGGGGAVSGCQVSGVMVCWWWPSG
ncbi:MAG: hypothetical protein MR828_03485 [Clostridiales bacterium]|nr:hypothetical protein [Clostridiales bacterium]